MGPSVDVPGRFPRFVAKIDGDCDVRGNLDDLVNRVKSLVEVSLELDNVY